MDALNEIMVFASKLFRGKTLSKKSESSAAKYSLPGPIFSSKFTTISKFVIIDGAP